MDKIYCKIFLILFLNINPKYIKILICSYQLNNKKNTRVNIAKKNIKHRISKKIYIN